MSCKACRKAQEHLSAAYFRWGNANIELRGCDRHLREVINALRKAQMPRSDTESDADE